MTECNDYLVLPELARLPGFVHGFTLKLVSQEKPEVEGRRPLFLRQIHGPRVVTVERRDGRLLPEGIERDKAVEGDGLVTDVPGILLGVRVADCLPVIFLAPGKGVAGIAHAGWRGTRARIGPGLIAQAGERYGLRPKDFLVGLGPAIGPCCYRVREDVREAFRVDFPDAEDYICGNPDGTFQLDLFRANRTQLREAGVPESQIFSLSLCTHCRADLFYSARREGRRGGRQVAFVGVDG